MVGNETTTEKMHIICTSADKLFGSKHYQEVQETLGNRPELPRFQRVDMAVPRYGGLNAMGSDRTHKLPTSKGPG